MILCAVKLMRSETREVFQFGPAYFFFNLNKRRNEIRFDDLAKKDQFEKFIAEKSKKLRKAKIPNFFNTEEILKDVSGHSFDDLTCIDRNVDDEANGVATGSNLLRIPIYLKEIRNDFLTAPVYISDLKKEYVHPMDIINRTLEKSEPESARILTENLDKLKYALPFVYPSYTEKSKLRLWPLVGINRQTRDRKFNMFQAQHSHHVVACVRLGHCDGFINNKNNKLPSHSKSEMANGIFFEDQPKFLSRSHRNLAKAMKRNVLGTMETAIHTPNNNFDKFFQVWNLHGNIMFDGLKPQLELISKSASAIIVILDDDKAIDFMERKIIEIFGSERIVVLVPGSGSNSDSDSDSDDSEHSSIKMNILKCLTYNSSRKQDTFYQVRSFVNEKFRSG